MLKINNQLILSILDLAGIIIKSLAFLSYTILRLSYRGREVGIAKRMAWPSFYERKWYYLVLLAIEFTFPIYLKPIL